jgi:hypothetical protein
VEELPCPAGSYCTSPTTMEGCPVFYWSDEPGKWADGANSGVFNGSCKECGAGQTATWAPVGQTTQDGACVNCSAGTYSAGLTGCLQCDLGSYSSEGQSVCTPCPVGWPPRSGAGYGETTLEGACAEWSDIRTQ